MYGNFGSPGIMALIMYFALLASCLDYVLAPGDYTNSITLITFEPGVSSRQVAVSVRNDALSEMDESFFGNLRLPTNSPDFGRVFFQPGRANATIVDDDGMVLCSGIMISRDQPLSISLGNYTIFQCRNCYCLGTNHVHCN